MQAQPNGTLFLRFGRRLAIQGSFLQLAVSGTCAAFAPTFLIYCSLRFLSGCSSVSILINGSLLSKSPFCQSIAQASIWTVNFQANRHYSHRVLLFFPVVEWTGSRAKATVLTLIFCTYGAGQMALGGLASAFREWRTLQLVVSLPFFVPFLCSR